MMDAPLEQIGRITTASEAGQFVLVRDDQERTGGFLIFQSLAADIFSAQEVFDSWVEHRDDVSRFLLKSGWNVEWRPHLVS